MKICAIGDPHGNLAKIKKIPLKGVDIIILTGDLGESDKIRKIVFENMRRRKEGLPELDIPDRVYAQDYKDRVKSALAVIRYLVRHAPVYTIFGNIDATNASTKRYEKQLGYKLPRLSDSIKKIKNAHVVNNVKRNINGIKIGFLDFFVDTCWVREFKPSDYRLRLKRAKKMTDKAKNILKRYTDVDILVCHQPPYGILDQVKNKVLPKDWQGKHAGSKAILAHVKKHQPKLMLCGHIHEAKGKKKVGKTMVHNLGVANHILFEM